MSEQIFRDSESDLSFRGRRFAGKTLIYALLILWTIICLFPIYWTITTSFKIAPNVMKGALIPWVDYTPAWLGWRSLGLSPDTIGAGSTVRDEFLKRFFNSTIAAISSSTIAVVLGSLAAYGLSRFSYKFGYMRNADISFFFLSQLILPPVVLALPFLVLYRELALLDTRIGLVLLYTLTVLPIVIWIMRDQFEIHPDRARGGGTGRRPVDMGRVLPDHPADRAAGHGGCVHPEPGADLERVFLRRPADLDPRQHAAGHGGIADGQPGHQLVGDGRALLLRDPAPHRHRRGAGALPDQGHDGGRGEVAAVNS